MPQPMIQIPNSRRTSSKGHRRHGDPQYHDSVGMLTKESIHSGGPSSSRTTRSIGGPKAIISGGFGDRWTNWNDGPWQWSKDSASGYLRETSLGHYENMTDDEITASLYDSMLDRTWSEYMKSGRQYPAGERPPTPGASSSSGGPKGNGKGKGGPAPR